MYILGFFHLDPGSLGGWCEDMSSCYSRALTDLGSSKAYPKTSDLRGGYFDPNNITNPQFYNW